MEPSEMSRYFLAIVPPSPVYEDALALKNYFKEKYHSKASLNSPPHITLHMPFLWKEKNEGELLTSLNDFAKGKKLISIVLSGFDAFPPRVIFISVKQNDQLNQFQNQLQNFFKTKLNLFHADYKDHPYHPHLTLAFRDLKKDMFTQAWNEFKEKIFSASFDANGFTLLKHDGKVWLPLHHFHF